MRVAGRHAPLERATFKKIAGCWLTGVAVVTTADDSGRRTGLTMSAVTSLSLEPPQFLICVDSQSDTLPVIAASGVFAIQYLRHDQEELAAHFAKKGGDKFASLPFRSVRTGAPILDGILAFVECTTAAVHRGGDHEIIVGDAIHGEVFEGEPLAYHRGAFRRVR